MSDLPQDGPGAELKTAREGMDVSTREVADALNLPVHVIEALEADDFERLPPTVFTRGYLRSYARLLELSPDSLLARYPEVTEEVDAITGELPAAELPAGLPARTLGIAAAVSLVLIVLLVFLLGDEDAAPEPEMPVAIDQEAEREAETEAEAVEPSAEREVTQPSVDGPAVEAVEVDSTPSLPAAVTREDPPAEVVVEEPAAVEIADAEPGETDPGESLSAPSSAELSSEDPASAETVSTEPALAEPLPAVAPSFRERRITEFGDDEVTMVFSEDCWVEVKSADGENLYSDLNRTGRTLVLTGRAPFRVLLGYAPGVTLSFNGEPVSLERYSRNNVANLVLGE